MWRAGRPDILQVESLPEKSHFYCIPGRSEGHPVALGAWDPSDQGCEDEEDHPDGNGAHRSLDIGLPECLDFPGFNRLGFGRCWTCGSPGHGHRCRSRCFAKYRGTFGQGKGGTGRRVSLQTSKTAWQRRVGRALELSNSGPASFVELVPLKIASAAALATLLAFAAPARADHHTAKDIVDTAVAAGSFKTLAKALGEAGLVATLKGPGPFTVFAPTTRPSPSSPPARSTSCSPTRRSSRRCCSSTRWPAR